MARSRPHHSDPSSRRRAGTSRVPARTVQPNFPQSAGDGVRYAPLPPDDPHGRLLFEFAGAPLPPVGPDALAWGAWMNESLVGALMVERCESTGMIHGPIVVNVADPLDAGVHLVSALLSHAHALRLSTLFTRPQGLDRVWVRFGFVPAADAMLPEPLKGQPGIGLFVWRESPGLLTQTSVSRS